MNEETPPAAPSAEAIPAPVAIPGPGTVHPRRRRLRRLVHWLGELTTVFVGVYAAFLLNDHANHRQERQRREQLLTWVEERYTAVLGNAKEQAATLRGKIAGYNAKVAAGEMPEVKPIGWIGDYDPSDSTSLLQSGGYALLDVETIRGIRETESSLRQLTSVALHAQQRSDELILPNRGKDPTVFYDPATRQLRASYDWLPRAYEDLKEGFEGTQTNCTKLLAQVRAERGRLE